MSDSRVLGFARALAKIIGQRQELVTADDVQFALENFGLGSEDLGNAAGAIFRTSDWEAVGFTESERDSNRARVIRTWRLVG